MSKYYPMSLNKIQTLNVGANGLGSQVDTIKLISSMKNITSLSIGSNDLKSEQFSLIIFLEINGNNLNSDSIIPITLLRKLKHLCVESNSLGTEGVKHLTSLHGLTYLDIGRNNIDQEGVYHLSLLPSLTHLDINTNKIGDEGAQYICTNMSQLKWLDISENHLTVTGVRKILKMKNRWLYLGI